MTFYPQASEEDVEMIRRFGGGKQKAKSKTSEKLPSLISTLMEEEKVIKEMLNLPENLSIGNLSNENLSSVKCEEIETAVEMEDAGNVETIDSLQVDEDEEVSKENSKSPKKDSEMETKMQELYSLILQTGDEGRIENFQKFVLNQESC